MASRHSTQAGNPGSLPRHFPMSPRRAGRAPLMFESHARTEPQETGMGAGGVYEACGKQRDFGFTCA